MKLVSLVRFVAVCVIPLFFVACGSRTTMFVDFDKVVDSKDFAEVVGNEVKFDFGSGSKEKIISYIYIQKVMRKLANTMRIFQIP